MADPDAGRSARIRRLAERVENTVLGDLLADIRRTRLLDVAYTLSAQTFVALIPLMIVVTAAFIGSGDRAVVARQLIERFGLVGATRQAVQVLFQTPGAGSGVYWFGLLLTLYSSFSLSRRVGRAYATIWDVRPLPPNRQWVGLAWVFVQVTMTVLATSLRAVGRDGGVLLGALTALVVLVLWAAAEYLVLQLLTAHQVARSRAIVAAVLVCAGRVGVGAWAAVYLPRSFAHQAQQYGPIGVVFAFFTLLFASTAATVGALLVAKVFTGRPARTWLSTDVRSLPPRRT